MNVSPEQIVKRVGRLCNLVSKPELNGACIMINSYDASKDRYAVTTLNKPTEESPPVSILVKLANIKVSVDPSELRARLYTEPPKLVLPLLTEFGRYLGEPCDSHNPERLCPKTSIKTALIVGPRDDNAVVVFEDYDFSFDGRVDEGCALMITKGHAITFRRCRFHGAFYGVLVGCKEGTGVEVVDESLREEPNNPILQGTPRVTFESCLFENCKRPDNCAYGAVIGTDGSATFLNCVFRNCSGGVLIKRGGRADFVHCTFTEVHSAGVELPRYGTCSMLHCLIEKIMMTGAFAMHGSHFSMMKCRVEGNRGSYSAGLLFCGKKVSTVMVTDCVVANCVFGIKVDFHHVNVTVTNTSIIDCSSYGMVIGDGVLGTVAVNNCTFTRAVLANASGEKCTVTVDGVRRAPSTRPAARCNCGRCGSCLSMRRATKTAGLGTVHCAKCNVTEPAEVKYKACSKCKQVCYCSRECQKEHWKEHKLTCHPSGLLQNPVI